MRNAIALEVRGGEVCFRDLYDLMDWSPECPTLQRIPFGDGKYRITAYTSIPASGVIGEGQRIDLHFAKVKNLPRLKWEGVPPLC